MKGNKILKCYIFFLSLFYSEQLFSQPDGTPYSISNYKIYDVMFQLVDNNNMPSYIALFAPLALPLAPRVKKLTKEEGGYFYLTEISPNLNYILGQGRPQSKSISQRSRFSIVYNPMIRMVLSDNSNPILPTNQKAGFRFDFNFKNKQELFKYNCGNIKKDSLELTFDNYDFIDKNLKLFISHSIAASFMHYSNGQPDDVPNSINPKINNYQNGDFSTNYLNAIYTYSRLHSTSRVCQFSTGLQWDWGIKGFVLAYTTTQQKEYGHLRLLTNLQLNSRPRHFGDYYKWKSYEKCDTTKKCYPKLVVHKLRIQTELILDNVKNYRPDLKYTYPFGVHIFYEIDVVKSRNVGFFLHGYAGRDYLNIRYDDLIASLSVGLTLHFKKLFPVYLNRIGNLSIEKCNTKESSNNLSLKK